MNLGESLSKSPDDSSIWFDRWKLHSLCRTDSAELFYLNSMTLQRLCQLGAHFKWCSQLQHDRC